MDKLAINPKVAGGSVGANVGILLVWILNKKLGAGLGEGEIAAVIGLCAFGAGYLVSAPKGTLPTVMLLFCLSFLAACSPLSGKALKDVMMALKDDPASFCLQIGGGGGGGAIALPPALPLAGGWGYLYLGRSNEPGSKVKVTSAGCEIEHAQPKFEPKQ